MATQSPSLEFPEFKTGIVFSFNFNVVLQYLGKLRILATVATGQKKIWSERSILTKAVTRN